jgi:hypothetical protein
VSALSRPDPALAVAKPDGASPFELRFIFSYFADYGDPLIDPEVKSYPEGLLQRLAAAGVNGVVWCTRCCARWRRTLRFPSSERTARSASRGCARWSRGQEVRR